MNDLVSLTFCGFCHRGHLDNRNICDTCSRVVCKTCGGVVANGARDDKTCVCPRAVSGVDNTPFRDGWHNENE